MMKKKIIQEVKKQKDKRLERRIWAEAKRGCPFKSNRGFDPEDDHCLECPEASQCVVDTQKRLLTIRNRLLQDTELGDQEWPEGELYLEIHRGNLLNNEEIKNIQNEIRRIAEYLLAEWDIHIGGWPEEFIHPVTLTFFRNCFPEWNEFEKKLEQEALKDSMHSFYEREREKVSRFPAYKAPDEDLSDVEERLIIEGNWRGFPFEDLFFQTEKIPRKVITNFTKDYFKWQDQIISRERAIAKEQGLFGQKKQEERWPMQWMLSGDNATIRNFMLTNNGKFFCELMRYMELNRMKKHDGEQVAKKLNAGGKKYVVVQVDRKAAAEELKSRPELKNIKVSDQKIYAFLKWMVRHDLIKELGKPGEHEYTAYAIGKWTSYPDPETGEMKPGKISFFVKQQNRQNLKKAVESRIW